MNRPGEIFVDDFQIVLVVEFVARQDAELVAGAEEGHRDHEVAGKLESVALRKGKIVRHRGVLHRGAGQFPLDGFPDWTGRVRDHRWPQARGRSLLADPSRVDRQAREPVQKPSPMSGIGLRCMRRAASKNFLWPGPRTAIEPLVRDHRLVVAFQSSRP